MAITRIKIPTFLRKNIHLIFAWPAAALLSACLLWGLTLSKLDGDKAAVKENARRQAFSLSTAYAEQLSRSVEQIDQITLSMKRYWEDPKLASSLELHLHNGLFPANFSLYASVIDRAGNIIISTVKDKNSLNVADREYFRRYQNGQSNGLLISQPTASALSGKTVILFSRPLKKADGTFDGAVVVAVEPAYLATFYNESSLGESDFVSARFVDGPVLATKVGHTLDKNRIYYRSDPIFTHATGALEEPKEKFKDNESRIVAWNMLEQYPLVALAALSEKNVFASYETMAATHRHFAEIGTLFLFVFAMVGMFFSARLAWRRQQEEEVKSIYRLAVDAAQEGFYMVRPMYDKDHRIRDFRVEDCNERGASMVGFTRNEVVGHRFSELVPENYKRHTWAIFRRAMETGFYEEEFRVPSGSPLAPAWLYRRFVRSGDGIAVTVRDISQAKNHEQALSSLANTDALTTLPNRHWLTNYLPAAVEHAKTSDTPLAILFIDLDNFKNINDTLGHEAGDELLRTAALRLKSVVRASDHVVRLGGDEFTIILEQIEIVDDVSRVARLIVKTLSEPFHIAGNSGNHVNASIGISMFPRDGDDGEALLKHADIAMYAAKAAGKGRYQFYQSHLSDSLILKLNKERALQLAVERDEFVLHYQPRVGAHTGKLSSMEALVRWHHPERGLVGPQEFIDVAEDTGLIIRLGELVIEKACAQIAQWKAQNLTVVPVSINVSGLQLKEGSVSRLLSSCIERYGIDPSLVEVELTESSMIERGTTVSEELRAIRSLGVKILIDDFGTGYSSLAQLQRLDVDALKVDRAFTTELSHGHEGEAFYKAIVSMADALNMCIVAEGVETAEQLRTLQALSCDEVQGYFISRAVPATEMAVFLLKRFLFPPSAPNNKLAVL